MGERAAVYWQREATTLLRERNEARARTERLEAFVAAYDAWNDYDPPVERWSHTEVERLEKALNEARDALGIVFDPRHGGEPTVTERTD